MLWTIFCNFACVMAIGVGQRYALGGFVHILLVLAVVALIVQLLTGRRAVL